LLTDFGFSTSLGSGRVGISHGKRGTPGYRAPELLEAKYDENGNEEGAEYTSRADIWAIGCILYEIATMKTMRTFGANGDWGVMNYAKGGEPLPQLKKEDNEFLGVETFCSSTSSSRPLTEQFNCLISRCLDPDPTGRPNTMELKASFEQIKLYL
jgi:serine/threonine protein kinase